MERCLIYFINLLMFFVLVVGNKKKSILERNLTADLLQTCLSAIDTIISEHFKNEPVDVPLGTHLYPCQDVGYKDLKCENGGECTMMFSGNEYEASLCMCLRPYYGRRCQYNGRVVQKFTLPTFAWTVQGDSKYIYVTLRHNPNVVAYKLDSNGTIMGSDYMRSVNSILPVGTNRSEHFASTMSNDGHLIFTNDDSHNISRVKTIPLALDHSNVTLYYSNITLGNGPGRVAIDQYHFMWVTIYNPGSADVEVYDNNGNMMAEFILAEKRSIHNGGILVTPDDQLYVADWSDFLIYTVQRNHDNVPVNLTYVSRVSFLYSQKKILTMLINFNYDKWSNVLMGHNPQVEIYQTKNKTFSKILPPEDNMFWCGVWTDPVTGYAFIVGDSNSLYVINYSDIVS